MTRHKAKQKPLNWGTTHAKMVEWYISQAKYDDNGCLITHLSGTPYGKTMIKFLEDDCGQSVTGDTHSVSLHRYIYACKNNIDYLTMPARRIVRHACNVKKCINIEHLVEGSPKDNNMDTLYSGLNPTHKLNVALVKQIRKEWKNIEPISYTSFYTKWAAKTGVGNRAIYDVVHHRTWREI